MCRKIITHCMHHDIAPVMLMDAGYMQEQDRPTTAQTSNGSKAYEGNKSFFLVRNPLRAVYHRCEVHSPYREWLLNTPLKCEWHSCCVPYLEMERCRPGLAPSHRAEECASYTLSHRYMHLPGMGRDSRPSSSSSWRTEVQNFERHRGDGRHWFPEWAHSYGKLERWEYIYFDACEKFYTLYEDTRILQQVAKSLSTSEPGVARAASFNFARALKALDDRRRGVDRLSEWASTPCRDRDCPNPGAGWTLKMDDSDGEDHGDVIREAREKVVIVIDD